MIGKAPIRLFLIRHGNTFEAGQTPTQVGLTSDLPLTEQGRKQARAFAAYLKAEDITPAAIYAGSLKRQTESAQIIARDLHIDSKLHLNYPALNEIDYGAWEGLTAEEITHQWPAEYAGWTEQSLWGEGIFGGSLQEHLKDIRSWLHELRHYYSSGDVIVGITSNGIIRFFNSFDPLHWKKLTEEKRMEDLKVKTGHYCELLLFKDSLISSRWNIRP